MVETLKFGIDVKFFTDSVQNLIGFESSLVRKDTRVFGQFFPNSSAFISEDTGKSPLCCTLFLEDYFLIHHKKICACGALLLLAISHHKYSWNIWRHLDMNHKTFWSLRQKDRYFIDTALLKMSILSCGCSIP